VGRALRPLRSTHYRKLPENAFDLIDGDPIDLGALEHPGDGDARETADD
jgi:hypothetical protein